MTAMTSYKNFPKRITKIDDLVRRDYRHITEADRCYFVGEYTARKGYAYSDTNQLILNFKKSMDRAGQPEWRHKEKAIQVAANVFRNSIPPNQIEKFTFVPIPPSKAKRHPHYDNRLVRMLEAIRPEPRLDIRELIFQTESTVPAHNQDVRPRPSHIEKIYRLDKDLAEPEPKIFALVDDVLTTGAHFRAAKSILSKFFPRKAVIGLFIARCVQDSTEF